MINHNKVHAKGMRVTMTMHFTPSLKKKKEEENVICEEDDDGYPKRRNKRFRSIDHIYKVTQPLLLGVLVHSKKVKLSCT
ncbi:hypothetical protein NC653_022282 [Populus alba x Populus x berolinensis]|uniref:Uncharacterized protein n=1 Tax=Populus alba x Populus x berolinensis TaxID=444605 RepID=A0AAD6MGS5_9ROSI|nr:hypothetical protein NC653_022282 [Populus alba x Populus x berolinensis]